MDEEQKKEAVEYASDLVKDWTQDHADRLLAIGRKLKKSGHFEQAEKPFEYKDQHLVGEAIMWMLYEHLDMFEDQARKL